MSSAHLQVSASHVPPPAKAAFPLIAYVLLCCVTGWLFKKSTNNQPIPGEVGAEVRRWVQLHRESSSRLLHLFTVGCDPAEDLVSIHETTMLTCNVTAGRVILASLSCCPV